jgi:hypothetical protein
MLCRTNAEAVAQAMNAASEGQRTRSSAARDDIKKLR